MKNPVVLSEPMVSYQSMDDQRVFQLISAIQNGISYTDFEQLTSTFPFSTKQWATFMDISIRSLQRYKKEGIKLNSNSSERVIEITMLFKYGVSVFEDQKKFEAWLNNDSIPLGGQKPASLLCTSFGIGLVKDELTRIEHGILA